MDVTPPMAAAWLPEFVLLLSRVVSGFAVDGLFPLRFSKTCAC